MAELLLSVSHKDLFSGALYKAERPWGNAASVGVHTLKPIETLEKTIVWFHECKEINLLNVWRYKVTGSPCLSFAAYSN